MAKMKDLTGKRFGLWTVLGFDKVVSGNYQDEIITLIPGRELDALVAEKVMGL